jgi:DNA-binding NarL/FixJ family response regulator
VLGKSAGAASDEVFAVAASRDDHEGGGGVDSGDAKTLKHATRDIYIPDLPQRMVGAATRRQRRRKAAHRRLPAARGVRHVLVERQEFAGAFEDSAPISTMLTSRELQIAYSVADGKCDKVIAYELGISEYTVREHMRRIFHKLKVSKRAALVTQLIKTRFDYRVAESR